MTNDHVRTAKLSAQLDAVSEPSIFHDLKQNNDVQELQRQNFHSGLMLSQSHQMLARTAAYGSICGGSGNGSCNGDGSKFVKRNRNSLSKQVGGLRNSVAAFFSKRKNEKRFGEFDSTSSLGAHSKKATSKNNLHFQKSVESQ